MNKLYVLYIGKGHIVVVHHPPATVTGEKIFKIMKATPWL